MSSSKHILFVVNWPPFFLSHRLPLALFAREKGYRVTIATGSGPEIERITDAGLPWHGVQMSRDSMRPVHEARTIAGLVRLYRDLNPDLVYHVTNKPILYGTLAARIVGVPAVVNAVSGMGHLLTDERAPRARLASFMFRTFMRHPNMKLILQNSDDLEYFERRRLAPAEAMHLIRGSGVDMHAFAPVAQRNDGPPVVVQTCRMMADKGVREFIEAGRIVRAKRPDVRFMLAGGEEPHNPTGIPTAELVTATKAGAIEWIGYQSDVAGLLGRASIYCLPSYYREGVPKSLIEAAACGLPLIATDNVGCREVVTDRVTGLTVPPRDATSLARAIEYMLDHPVKANEMGQRAREKVEREFSLETVLNAILGVCESVLSPDRSDSGEPDATRMRASGHSA